MGLFSNLVPDQLGPYSLSDADKKRLRKTGLLTAGLSMLATPTGQGSALMGISKGLLAGLDSAQGGAQDSLMAQYKTDPRMLHAQLPADIQTMEYYKQNPEALAMQMKLRQASANPFGFETMTGEDGIPRLVQTNKREGGAAVIGEGGVPVGAGAGPKAGPKMSALDVAANIKLFGGQVTSGYRTPEHNKEVGGVPNSYHVSGKALDVVMPSPELKSHAKAWMESQGYQVIDEGDHLHAEPPPSAAVPAGAFTGRRAEDQALAVASAQEQAKVDAQVNNAPVVSKVEADAAALKAAAEKRASMETERVVTAQTSLPEVILSGNQAIATIDKALLHPGRHAATGLSSVLDPRNFIAGTDAKDFRATVDQIKGKAFLEAFQKLKGSGQITEVEGKKATDAISALELAQSDDQFAQALRDLKSVIKSGVDKARNAALQPRKPVAGGWSATRIK